MAFHGMAQINKKDLWTIPNLITYFRILCIPAFVVLMAYAGIRSSQTLLYVALGVFVLAAGSDLVDGWIARRFNMVTGIGMVLDPFADKVMHVSVLLTLSLCTGLTQLGSDTSAFSDGWYVHYAFVILILFKELIMICASPIIMKKGAKIQANWMGKVASATVSAGIMLAFFHPYVGYADWGILAWGLFLSYGALAGYIKEVFHQIKLINEGKMERVTDESVKYTNAENTEVIAPISCEGVSATADDGAADNSATATTANSDSANKA